jgi:hypothetical protein
VALAGLSSARASVTSSVAVMATNGFHMSEPPQQ